MTGRARARSEERSLHRLLVSGETPGATVRYGDHEDEVHETYGPPEGPAVLLVHGGYFRPRVDRTHARPMARQLGELGLRVVLPEYRRVPGEPDVCVADLLAAERVLRASGWLGAAPVTWVGHSAGGTLALLRTLDASLPPVDVLALAPVSDLARNAREGLGSDAVPAWLGGMPADRPGEYARLDPVGLLRGGARPGGTVTVLHGDADATVPLAHSTDLLALGVPGLTVTVLTGAHHLDLVDPASPSFAEVVGVLVSSRARASSARATSP